MFDDGLARVVERRGKTSARTIAIDWWELQEIATDIEGEATEGSIWFLFRLTDADVALKELISGDDGDLAHVCSDRRAPFLPMALQCSLGQAASF